MNVSKETIRFRIGHFTHTAEHQHTGLQEQWMENYITFPLRVVRPDKGTTWTKFVCPQCGEPITVRTASAISVKAQRKLETLIGLAALALAAFIVFRNAMASEWISLFGSELTDVLYPALGCLTILAGFGGIGLILHGSSVMSSDFDLTLTLISLKSGHKLFSDHSR